MLKWSRTPQQPRRSTVPGVSGQPNGGRKNGEVTPSPGPKIPKHRMSLDLEKEVVGSTSGTQLTTKYTKRASASNLTRTDSGKSSRSNRSGMTLSAFDPESAGTLPRDTEVTYSMYDGDTAGGSRPSSSFGTVDPPSSTSQQEARRTSTTSHRSSTTSSNMQNGDIHINGDLNTEPSTETKSMKMTTTATRPTRISASDSRINQDMSPEAKEARASIIDTLDNLLVDLDHHDKSFDESMVTASLDRKLVTYRAKTTTTTTTTPTKKVGAFSMRSAFDDSPLDKKSLSNTSLHDDKFKGDLSTKLLNGQNKTNISDPHLDNTTAYSSLKRETTTSLLSSTGKIGSGQEIANVLDRNAQVIGGISAGGLTNGAATSDEIASYKGHDPNLIGTNEATTTARNSKTSTTDVTSTMTTQTAAGGDGSSARPTSQLAKSSSISEAAAVTRSASQKSDQNNNLSRPSSRSLDRRSDVVDRSSVARSESGRSASPQFKVRDIRGSLSRPTSSISGTDRTSSNYGAYSPNRLSFSSSPTRQEVSGTSTNIVTTSTGRVKRVDSGASASSRRGSGPEVSSKRTSVISTASSSGAAGVYQLPNLEEIEDRTSEKSASQRTSVISSTSRSTITEQQQKAPSPTVSRTSSVASQGSRLQGSRVVSRAESGLSRKSSGTQSQSTLTGRPESQLSGRVSRSSKVEGQVSRPESQASRAEGRVSRPESQASRVEGQLSRPESQASRAKGRVSRSESQASRVEGQLSRPESQASRASSTSKSGSSSSLVTSYQLSGQRKPSKGSDTDDKFIDGVDTEQRSELQKNEITLVEKEQNVYMTERNSTEEREQRTHSEAPLPTSSTSYDKIEKENIQKLKTFLHEDDHVERREEHSDHPEASSSPHIETYDSVFETNDDGVNLSPYKGGYTTQYSYGSLTSNESTGDRSFRKSASDLLEDYKSGRLGSPESTLGKNSTSYAGTTSATSTASRVTDRPKDISLMGVSTLEQTTTTTVTRDKNYDDSETRGGTSASQTYATIDTVASGGHSILNGDKSPSSPIVEEAQQAVTPGTVSKLTKDVFANLHLTGRFIDPSSSTLERAKTPDPDDDSDDAPPVPEKKYKFMVEGIDVPAQEGEEHAEEAGEETADLSPSLDSLERKPKGFSYVKIDSGLAGEIEKRAKTVSSKKPHEVIEVKKASSEKIDESHYESLELKDARAKLHRQIIQSHQHTFQPPGEVESLREARAKLNKQIAERRITSSSEEVADSAPSAGISSESSRVGGSQTQALSAQQHQLQHSRTNRDQAAVTATPTVTATASRVEPTGHKLVTPVDESTTVISTSTVREETSTNTTSTVPLPPPPQAILPTQSQSSSTKRVTSSRTGKTSDRKETVLVENIGEDIAEDFKDTRIEEDIIKAARVPVAEERIKPKHSGLLYDLDDVDEAQVNQKTTEEDKTRVHRDHKKQQEDLHAVRKEKSTAEVIEVIEPVISSSTAEIRKTKERKASRDYYDNTEDRDKYDFTGAAEDQIDEAFDRLEREHKYKQYELQQPRASTSTASGVNNDRTAAGSTSTGAAGRQQLQEHHKTSTTSEGLPDQLSPDSAYQSAAASPIFVTTTTTVKDIAGSQPQHKYLRLGQEPIMVQRGEELTFTGPAVGSQQYESRKMMMKSSKMSSKSSKQVVNGETVQQAESRELSEKQMQYENSGRPNDDGLMVSSSRNESVAYRGAGPPEPARAIGGGPNATARTTINHPIQMNGDVTAAHYPSSSTVDSTRIMNSAQTDYNSDVRHHHNIRAQAQHGGGYSASSIEDLYNTANRQQDGLHYQQQQQQRTGVTRKASHLSSSSAGSGAQRIVQLRPLTVDVNMANRGGTSGPSGMFSPSVKHSQAMYEIQNMTGGSYAQYNGYSPGQLDNADYRTYNSTGRMYRTNAGHHRKYLKVDETCAGKIPMYNRDYNSYDIGYRDLEGYQYRRSRRHPYVARVNLEGDPYFSDFDGGSVHSEPPHRMQRRISSRSRQRTLPSTVRHWSSSQPSGLHQVPVGDPVHLNIHPQQGHGYGGSSGRLYRARSEGMLVEAAMAGRGGGGEILSPTLTDAHQTRRGDYHITLKLNHLGRGMLDSASTGSYEQGWGTLGDEASNTWNYKSGASWQRDRGDPKASVSLVDIELNDSGVHEPPATRQPTTVTLHSDPRDQADGSLQHWFRAYHQHHEAMHNSPSAGVGPPVVTDPDISTTIPRYNSNPPASPQKDAAFAMQVNQTMRMDYKPNEQPVDESIPRKQAPDQQQGVPKVVRGSILIKNTIDTTGGARVIDVVEQETDGEGEPLLDDNTNLFHNTYHQGKENPMYSSDEDLSRMHRKPAFTKIFQQQDETDYIDIPVTKGPRRSGKPRKGHPQRPVEEHIKPSRGRPREAPPKQKWPDQFPVDERIDPRNTGRPQRGVEDDPDPIEETITPTRATDRENPVMPQWPGEVPDENIEPRRAPKRFAPNQNGYPEPTDEPDQRPTRAPKIFVDEYDPQQEVPYEEDYPPTSPERLIPIEIERPEQDIVVRREKPRKKASHREEEWVERSHGSGRNEEVDITRLLRNAPAGSVKQTINVEREEEEILGPLQVNDAEGEMSDPEGLLNFDTISEKVDLGILDGKAQLAVKVRCERVVPIRGVEDMFKKSSVIVTRLIQIDMEATEERQRLYSRIMRGSNQQMIEGADSRFRSRGGVRKLDTKETFNLYKTFMGVAEAHEGNERERVKIERRIEDQKQLPEQAEFEFNMAGDDIMGNGYADGYDDGMDYDDGDFDTDELERRLERKMRRTGDSGMRLEEMPGGSGRYLMKNPEPDTISYISQASEHSDLLY